MINRRQALKLGLVGALALPRRALAFGAASAVRFAVLKDAAPVGRMGGFKRLAMEVERRTAIQCADEAVLVDGGDDEIFAHPIVFAIGAGEAPPWGAARWARLAAYVRAGGMIVFDSTVAGDGYAEACIEHLASHLPAEALVRADEEHVLYRSFYLLKNPVGRLIADEQPRLLMVDGRVVAIATGVDLLGALQRDEFGAWAFACSPGGESQRERATRWGINLIMYATCTDYKADQVHIPFLLKRRR